MKVLMANKSAAGKRGIRALFHAGRPCPALPERHRSAAQTMIAPLAKFLDWSAIQMVWGRRVKSLLKGNGQPPNPKLEEALQFLKGPDFIPVESPLARPEFIPNPSGLHFRFPTPRPGEFEENNVVYGRLYRCAERWQKRPVIILLHGAGGSDYYLEFPWRARQCNRVGFNAATLMSPFHFQRRPRQLEKRLNWPDYLLMAEIDYAQAVAEIRALTGWLLAEGCPAVALWGNSYGGALAGLTACRDARLSAAVLVAPGLDMNVFLSAARQIVWPDLREELLRQQPACEALNLTALNLTHTRPCIPKENILLIEAVHDLFVDSKSMEALWHAWEQPDIWRLPHSHASKILSPSLTGRVLRWLSSRLDAPAVRNNEVPPPAANGRRPKGHSGKVIMARRLRQETTMSLKWIAERLQMGSWTYVSNLLHENQNNEAAQEVLPLCQY